MAKLKARDKGGGFDVSWKMEALLGYPHRGRTQGEIRTERCLHCSEAWGEGERACGNIIIINICHLVNAFI